MSSDQSPKNFPELLEGILDVIDDAPLLQDESQADFDLLQHSILSEIKPRNLTEKFLANELTRSLWELRRYRRIRDTILNRPSRDLVRERLTELLRNDDEAKATIKEWKCLYDDYVRYVAQVWRIESDEDALLAEHYLKKHGVSMSEIVADGLSRRMKTLMPLEAMIAELVKRCDRILAELDRRADTRAKLIDLAPMAPSTLTSDDTDDGEPI